MEKKKRKSKVSIEEWIERCNKKHKNYYGYSKSIFEYLTDDVIIICPRHGEFIKKAHLHFKSGCNYCSKNKLLHIDEVKEKLSKNIYFDILPFENYIGNRQKIEVICKKNKHYGDSMAVNVGDAVLLMGYELLLECGYPYELSAKAVTQYLRGVVNTAWGQALIWPLPSVRAHVHLKNVASCCSIPTASHVA
jgi:hypothetical protein